MFITPDFLSFSRSSSECLNLGWGLRPAGADDNTGQGFGQLWEGGEWQPLFEGLEFDPKGLSCPTAIACVAVGRDSEGAAGESWLKVGETWNSSPRPCPTPKGAPKSS